VEFKFKLCDDDREYAVPGEYEVCWQCEGKGTIVNPAVDGNGLGREDFDADPDFERDYFAGVFDIKCPECGGLRVLMQPDEEKMTDEEKRLLKQYYEEQDDIAACEAEMAAERRMGA
jgi:rRNA maturation protein Nop10